jgi:sec-independent protein translocase protein TatA
MPNIGPLELIIVLVIILVVFGPKRLPQLGRQLGSGMREFKNGITGKARDDDDDDDEPDGASARSEPPQVQPGDPLDPEPDPTRPPTGARDDAATRRGP